MEYNISNSKLSKKTRNLFGEVIKKDCITSKRESYLMDAFKSGSKPVIHIEIVETDYDFASRHQIFPSTWIRYSTCILMPVFHQ